jgi:DNA-binding beta-propeller fold protein YncE
MEIRVNRHTSAIVSFALVTLGSLLATQLVPAQTPAAGGELKLLKTFKIGAKGGWDYPLVDAAARRLYIARATRVMVQDLDKGTLLGEVADINGAHGIAIAADLGFATAGKDNAVVVFDLKTFKTLRKIKTGKGPDAILYDPASKKIFAMGHGGGDVTVIDPAYLDKEPVTIVVGGKLEFGATDGAGRVFVNVEDKDECVAIDSKQLKILARWTLGAAKGPTGLDIDPVRHRLFVGCTNKQMAILDSDSGKLLATVPIGAGVDGVAYDAQLGALSANGKDGTVTVVRETAPGTFAAVQTVKTVVSGKTIAVDSKTHQAYLPANVPGEGDGGTTFGVAIVGIDKAAAK